MKFCPECGAKVVSQKFCQECGINLSKYLDDSKDQSCSKKDKNEDAPSRNSGVSFASFMALSRSKSKKNTVDADEYDDDDE